MRGTDPTATRRRAATRRPLERARRRGTLALLAAAVVLGLLNGRGVAGALDPGVSAPGDAAAPPGVSAPLHGGARPDAGRPARAVAPAARGSGPAYVVVAEGDTLWDLLAPHAPDGTDPAVYVALVARAADLEPRALVPGTVVRLP